MVADQLERRGIKDPQVLHAFRSVPRHCFVLPNLKEHAYDDCPLPIPAGQTISQPYIVALMTELLKPATRTKVLEIGTGSGYQAAILAFLGCEVVTVERIPQLYEFARHNLAETGLLQRVTCILDDGSSGYEARAPYDRIIITAATPAICREMTAQLNKGGRLVAPVGNRELQELVIMEKQQDGSIEVRKSIPCRFVPLIGKAGFPPFMT